MRILMCLALLLLLVGCKSKSRYSGFPDSIAEDAIEREGKVSKQDVVAATGKLKVGMTEQELRDVLQPYDVGLGNGQVVGKERVELIYLVHGILVDAKFDGTKDPKVDKVVAFDVRTFHGW